MASNIYANTMEVPMDLNDMDKNQGETNNNGVPVDNSATAQEEIIIIPGISNPEDNSSLSKASATSTTYKDHLRTQISDIFPEQQKKLYPK